MGAGPDAARITVLRQRANPLAVSDHHLHTHVLTVHFHPNFPIALSGFMFFTNIHLDNHFWCC